MTIMLTGPVTVRALLCEGDAGQHPAETIAGLVGARRLARPALSGARHLSASAARAVDTEIGTIAESLLDVDLGTVLVSCWAEHRSLVEAARATLAAPGTEQVVDLARHRATASYAPHVDLFVDEVRVSSLELVLLLVFDVRGVAAVVRQGALVGLRGGDCDVTATLGLEGVELRQCHQRFDPALVVPVDPPIRLTGEPA